MQEMERREMARLEADLLALAALIKEIERQ